MEEQDPATHPNVPPGYGLLCFVGWCQNRLARFTMRPVDYDEYVRISWDHNDEEPFNDVFLRQMSALLEDPKYTYLRVYWNVRYSDFIGEVELEDNPLYLFPVALCSLFNALICVALFGSLTDLPRRRRDIALEVERLLEELRELDPVERALLLIGESANGVGNEDDAAPISRALDLIRQYRDRTEWAPEEFLDRMFRESR